MNNKQDARLVEELGEGYEQKILKFLGSKSIIERGGSPTWWMTCYGGWGWKGKSYWVRKALKKLEADGKVESYNTKKNGIGWYWALKGKMNIDWV